MPTYEYQCKDCGHRVDYFQSMSEPARTECPQCKGRLQRLVSSGAGLIFKGSGFYITDYKHKNSPDGSGYAASKSRDTESGKSAADKPAKEVVADKPSKDSVAEKPSKNASGDKSAAKAESKVAATSE